MTSQLIAHIKEALRDVIDPELGYNIVDLGLVYDIRVEADGVVVITMTTTTAGCPATAYLKDGVANRAAIVAGVRNVDVCLTFNPPWKPEMMTAQARADLGFAACN